MAAFTAEMATRAIYGEDTASDTCYYASSSEFAIVADFEETDNPSDPELCRADYWQCIKCKNDQNNPMYRYCEKCYQVSSVFVSLFCNVAHNNFKQVILIALLCCPP